MNIVINNEEEVDSRRLESRRKRRTNHIEPSSVAVTIPTSLGASSLLPNPVSSPIGACSSPPHTISPCIPFSSFPPIGEIITEDESELFL